MHAPRICGGHFFWRILLVESMKSISAAAAFFDRGPLCKFFLLLGLSQKIEA